MVLVVLQGLLAFSLYSLYQAQLFYGLLWLCFGSLYWSASTILLLSFGGTFSKQLSEGAYFVYMIVIILLLFIQVIFNSVAFITRQFDFMEQ
jgi:hypothetical protein